MKRFWIFFLFTGLSLCRGEETNHLGTLTSSNRFVLSGSPPFVVSFEHLDVKTNVFSLLNHKELFIEKTNVPSFFPPGIIRMTVSGADGQSETNAYTFWLPALAPRVRLSKRYPQMVPPLPFSWKPDSLPGGTNREYADSPAEAMKKTYQKTGRRNQ
jgi:hypothetical protein